MYRYQIISVSGYSLLGINEEINEWAQAGWRVVGIDAFKWVGDGVKGLVLLEQEYGGGSDAHKE